MSNDNVLDHETENTTTTTRFQQTKTKVTEFVKRNKTAIGVGFGLTALVGLGAVVRSITNDDDDDYTEFQLELNSENPDDDGLLLILDTDGNQKLYAEVESGDSSDVTDESDDNVTESTE